MGVSVLILTYNEEKNIGRCLDALSWCDDVVVLDSFSFDRTCAIAESYSARVQTRAFDNYAAQRNFGLKEIDYKYPWVLMVDADEVVTPALAAEILQATSEAEDDVALFRFRRKDYFLGKWIRRSSGYPTWFGRLVRPYEVMVTREINEEYVTSGKVGFLKEHILHYPFAKGIAYWIEKHNRYSTLEALAQFESQSKRSFNLRSWFSRDPAERRAVHKAVLYSLPFRPGIVFLLLYVVRGGFLDGKAGLLFSVLRMFYEIMIDLKRMESQLRKSGNTI